MPEPDAGSLHDPGIGGFDAVLGELINQGLIAQALGWQKTAGSSDSGKWRALACRALWALIACPAGVLRGLGHRVECQATRPTGVCGSTVATAPCELSTDSASSPGKLPTVAAMRL